LIGHLIHLILTLIVSTVTTKRSLSSMEN